MIARLVPLLAVCATLAGLIFVAGATFQPRTTSAGSATPFRCPGAEFSFPVNGSLGWIYREPDSIASRGILHTGLAVWARRRPVPPGHALAAALAGLSRQFLHAHRLAFRHPATGERLELAAPLAADLAAALAEMEDATP